MNFKPRKYRFKSEGHAQEKRNVKLAFAIGAIIVIALIYFFG